MKNNVMMKILIIIMKIRNHNDQGIVSIYKKLSLTVNTFLSQYDSGMKGES